MSLDTAQPPQQLQAFLDGLIRLSLEELGQQANLDPMLALLMLPVRPEAELKTSSQENMERLSLLTREDLIEIATISAKDLRHTRVAQEWIEEGRLEGRLVGEAQSEAKMALRLLSRRCRPSANPPPPASRPYLWSSWKPWRMHY